MYFICSVFLNLILQIPVRLLTVTSTVSVESSFKYYFSKIFQELSVDFAVHNAM